MKKVLIVIFLLVVLLMIIGTFSIYRAVFPVRTISGETCLEIKINGPWPEEPDRIPQLLESSRKQNFRKRVDAIRNAADDERVKKLVLYIYSNGLSMSQIEEFSRAVDYFNNSGKESVAFIFDSGTGGMYAASHCSRRVILPSMDCFMSGIHAEVKFYKGMLDMIGVEVESEQMKEYKSATEPLTRKYFSEPAREDLNSLLDNMFSEVVHRMSIGTGAIEDSIIACMKRSPVPSEVFKRVGLVTDTGYPMDVLNQFPEDYDMLELDDYVSMTSGSLSPASDKIAVLTVEGTISVGEDGKDYIFGKLIGDETILDAIHEVEDDDDIKALVLRVNSPGGSLTASDRVRHALISLSEKKPVVASMGAVAASGGYYISMPAKVIVADSSTITGSIGVLGMKMCMGELYGKLGITVERFNRGGTNFFDETRKLTAVERKRFRESIERGYDLFVSNAASDRNMDPEKMDQLAGGRIWTGVDAYTVGLVDTLGGIDTAIRIAGKLAGFQEGFIPDIVDYPGPKSLMEFIEELNIPFTGAKMNTPVDLLRSPIERFSGGIMALCPYSVSLSSDS